MRLACAVIVALSSGSSFAQLIASDKEEMARWARVEADLRQLKIERGEFNRRHTLVGKTIKAAAEELTVDGYRCTVGYVDHVTHAPGDYRMLPLREALLYCERQSAEPGDFCAQRHVRLAGNWPDYNQPLSVLEQQTGQVVVTHTTFRCDTPIDVDAHRKRRD